MKKKTNKTKKQTQVMRNVKVNNSKKVPTVSILGPVDMRPH